MHSEQLECRYHKNMFPTLSTPYVVSLPNVHEYFDLAIQVHILKLTVRGEWFYQVFVPESNTGLKAFPMFCDKASWSLFSTFTEKLDLVSFRYRCLVSLSLVIVHVNIE